MIIKPVRITAELFPGDSLSVPWSLMLFSDVFTCDLVNRFHFAKGFLCLYLELNVTGRHESDPVFIDVSEMMGTVFFPVNTCSPEPTTRSSALHYIVPLLGLSIKHINTCRYLLAPVHVAQYSYSIVSQ